MSKDLELEIEKREIVIKKCMDVIEKQHEMLQLRADLQQQMVQLTGNLCELNLLPRKKEDEKSDED